MDFVKKFYNNYLWNFAVEAQKLVGISLEGKRWLMLKISNLNATIDNKSILNGLITRNKSW
jgi:hypothetical protein